MLAPSPDWFVGLRVDPDPWFSARIVDRPRNTRPVHPDDLYVTVAFLGSVDEAAARAAWAEVVEVPAFDIGLGSVEPLGAWALAARVDAGRAPLEAWMGRVGPALRGAVGLEPERRRPTAHCTVAGMTPEATADDRQRVIEWARAIDVSAVYQRLDRLALFTWAGGSGGRRHLAVEERRARR